MNQRSHTREPPGTIPHSNNPQFDSILDKDRPGFGLKFNCIDEKQDPTSVPNQTGSGDLAKMPTTAQLTISVGLGGRTMKPVHISPALEHFPHPELASLQLQLDQLRMRLSDSTAPAKADIIDEEVLLRLVTEILRLRRRREKVFGAELFGEPAWDMLLELYAAERAQQKLSVSSVCYASAVPATTALRWLLRLQKEGLVRRVSDPLDGRRSWVVLTDFASTEMRKYLAGLALRPA